jgi:hypothetical protein
VGCFCFVFAEIMALKIYLFEKFIYSKNINYKNFIQKISKNKFKNGFPYNN